MSKTDSSIPTTDNGWKDYLQSTDADPVSAIIERARRISECRTHRKENKRGGTFAEFVETTLGIGESTAREWAGIGEQAEALREQREILREMRSDFPASYSTFIELSILLRDFPEQFGAYVADDAIGPDMTRKDAKALLAGAKRAAVPGDAVDLDTLVNELLIAFREAEKTVEWRFRVETVRDEMETLLSEVAAPENVEA